MGIGVTPFFQVAAGLVVPHRHGWPAADDRSRRNPRGRGVDAGSRLGRIQAANDGDTVQLPAGTAVWKHGWNSEHWAKMKAIMIQGAGIDETIIRTDTTTAPGDKAFVINGVEGKPFRITGITFDGTGFANAGTWAGEVVINGNCKNFRVDHCKFLNMDHMITITGDTFGLVDHCKFCALKKNRLAQTIYCQGPGKVAFTRPLTLGTAQAVYFEDNDVRFSPEVVNTNGNNPWIVPYSGARVVIRHNTIVNSQLEIYRVRPGALGSQSTEIYDNTFSAEGVKMGRPQGFIFIAGGAALVFNNTVIGTTFNTRTIQVSHERSFGPIGEFGICDGTNPIGGNQIPAGQKGEGYPAFGQPGRATDADSDGVFEPSPCYAWNNTLNGKKLNMVLRTLGQSRARGETGRARQRRTGFLQREARSRILPAVYLSSSAAKGLGRIREWCRSQLNAATCSEPIARLVAIALPARS